MPILFPLIRPVGVVLNRGVPPFMGGMRTLQAVSTALLGVTFPGIFPVVPLVNPCEFKVDDCLPCNDAPIENLTAEGPDNPSFLGTYRPPYTPRLGRPFESLGCVRWCFSEVSQEEADLCAQHQAEECQNEDVFYSASKTCEIICPSGGGVSETVEPGTVISSISQADADARAEAVACRKASLNACSFVDLPIPNEAQGISCISGTALIALVELPANLSIEGPTLTVAAGSFSAETQAEANALAAQYVTDYMNAGLDSGELECGDMEWVVQTDYTGMTGGLAANNNACAGSREFPTADGTFGTVWPDDPSYTQINTGLEFEMSIHANGNNTEYIPACDSPGNPPCSSDGAATFFSTSEIGPFASDRNVTVLVEGELQRIPSLYAGAASACVPVAMTDADGVSALVTTIAATGIGTVDSDGLNCLLAESPKAYSYTMTYLLPATVSFYVNGTIRTRGPGSVSSVHITITMTPSP